MNDGQWQIYISPRGPKYPWVVRGGPAPSIELALLEAMGNFDRMKKEVAVPTSNFEVDLGDLGI